MKKKDKTQYHSPRIGTIIQAICDNHNLDFNLVKEQLRSHYPELFNKEKCANCNASMAIYTFKIDVLDALLLQGMGRVLRERMVQGTPFTEANKVHVQSTLNDYYSVPSRTTQCAKLGLIAKVIRKDGTHDQKAGWLITRRGFDFLQGLEVPCMVDSFRGKIVCRFEETTTIDKVYDEYRKSKKALSNTIDYTVEINKHATSQWVNVSGYFPSNLI